jgi:hypothetical protein
MNLETRIKIEKRIASTIVKSAIAQGYSVTIDNGGGWEGDYEIEGATQAAPAIRALMATDEETIIFCKGPRKVGAVFLVYGNDGWDVISDHTVNAETYSILQPALNLANKLEQQYA